MNSFFKNLLITAIFLCGSALIFTFNWALLDIEIEKYVWICVSIFFIACTFYYYSAPGRNLKTLNSNSFLSKKSITLTRAILQTLFKGASVIIIFIIWWAVTCGGNLLGVKFFRLHWGYFWPEYLFWFWIIEIILCFMWAVYFIFNKQTPTRTKVLSLITIISLIIGLVTAVIYYPN
jgi:hypothetical protein